MVYKWKDSIHPNVPASVAGEVCNELANAGQLTAKNLVNASRPEDAPLHKCFEWDDTVAAELYREHQGRNIINHIVIEHDDDDDKPREPVRAFFRILSDRNEYEPIHTIVRNEDKYRNLLEMAKRELNAFRVKYRNLKELEGVFAEIDKVNETEE